MAEYYDEAEETEADPKGHFYEFDCPICEANNPYDDGFKAGDEMTCNYCGCQFKVHVSESGRLKLREL